MATFNSKIPVLGAVILNPISGYITRRPLFGCWSHSLVILSRVPQSITAKIPLMRNGPMF